MEPTAHLVFDGVDFSVPSPCGEARDDQLQGTPLEKLCELSGRECYDSLGKGRDSTSYHDHVLQVQHLSVFEHANFTIEINTPHVLKVALAFLNRPGVWVSPHPTDITKLRVTLNLRSVLDWKKWDDAVHHLAGVREYARHCVTSVAARLAPQIVRDYVPSPDYPDIEATVSMVAPDHDEERWVSLRLAGSRGLTHEQVRHGDRTAMSQRSTRYVDESESDWCLHPLMHKYCDRSDMDAIAKFIAESKSAYVFVAGKLFKCLTDADVDKGTARKQARGAARGLLGNALGSSMIFSASVAQWRRMLLLRMSDPADAEIRILYNPILQELRRSCHGERFADMMTVPARDGLGEVIDCQT